MLLTTKGAVLVFDEDLIHLGHHKGDRLIVRVGRAHSHLSCFRIELLEIGPKLKEAELVQSQTTAQSRFNLKTKLRCLPDCSVDFVVQLQENQRSSGADRTDLEEDAYFFLEERGESIY